MQRRTEIVLKQEILFMIIVILFWFGQYVYIPYQTIYLNENKINEYLIGVIVGVYGVSQLICRFPVGIFANFVEKHKRFIIVGCIFSGLASVFRIFLTPNFGFLLGNIFSGLASTMWISFMIFHLNKYEEEQQRATSKIVMLNNGGMLLGFLISTLFYEKIGMKNICILSIISGLVAAILSFSLHEKETRREKVILKELLKCCKSKRLVFMGSLALIQQGVQMTTAMSFTNRILQTLTESSWIIGISSIIYMCSAVIFSGIGSTKLFNRKEPKFWIILIFLLLGIYTIGVSNTENIWMILLLQLIPGVSTGILFSFLTSEALKGTAKYQKSTAMGLYQAIYALGMTIFPIVIGKIIESDGIKEGYNYLTGTVILGAFLTWLIYKTIEKNKDN